MKPASRNRAHVTAALVAGLFAANEQAFGQTFPFPPVQSAICTPTYVDKDKLAAYLLKKYPVSLLAWEEGGGAAPGSSSRQVLATLLAEEKICEKKC
ncbi:MAG: hypothetical protein ACXWAC_12405, partial [Usitatibacter sp.]